MCVIGVGIGRFMFNIWYMCYKFGDRQICVYYRVCVLQVSVFAGLCLI